MIPLPDVPIMVKNKHTFKYPTEFGIRRRRILSLLDQLQIHMVLDPRILRKRTNNTMDG